MAGRDGTTLSQKLECPICLDFLEVPIKQCVIGHSFCTKCIDPNNIKKCPECRSDILDTRNYKLEELLETLPFPCVNKKSGCPYMLSKELMTEHILECKHRTFKCEGKIFCNWKCNWEGHNIHDHFKNVHVDHTLMEYNTYVSVAFNSTTKFSDIQLISAHYQLFWYKHRIDVEQKNAYWVFQYIGPHNQAHYYYYEFEIYNNSDSIRRLKIMEYCQSDIDDINIIFNSNKCVVVPLDVLKTYTDEKNEYSFRFRLMKKKKEDTVTDSKIGDLKPVSHKNTGAVKKPSALLPTPPVYNTGAVKKPSALLPTPPVYMSRPIENWPIWLPIVSSGNMINPVVQKGIGGNHKAPHKGHLKGPHRK